jgi:parallel beta-helix repeat protein
VTIANLTGRLAWRGWFGFATVALGEIALFPLPLVFSDDAPKETPKTIREIVVTKDTKLEKNALLNARIIIKASHVTLDGNGATLVGQAKSGNLKSFESAGAGIRAEGCSNITIRNIKVKGFATGLAISDAKAWTIEDCDFSDNYHNPQHGWGELPARGGIFLTRVCDSVIRKSKARNVWDGLYLFECNDNLISDNDFSHCSNVCAKLWASCRNRFLNNNLSYGLRIDRSKGEVHARDSTCVLIETGSDDNYWYRNDITHGGDGIFIRSLNGWVSRGNVFVENDTSYANNNCVESWSPGNTYIRNKANHGSYGFWLGGSDQTRLIGNEASHNGLADGFHNAPEPGFGHGGIVVVGGPSSHTVLDGNHCHHNNGGGIVFRGDGINKNNPWLTHHWIVQNNRLHDNKWGIWGRWGDWIHLANNTFENNSEGNSLKDVANLIEVKSDPSVQSAPIVRVTAPRRAMVGKPVRFDASASTDPAGRPLRYRWDLGGGVFDKATVENTFDKPGFYRVGLTVDNGVLAELAYRDLIVAAEVKDELGTEGQAARWGFDLEGNDGRGKMQFVDDEENALVGRSALRFTPNPYPGLYATAIFPGKRDAEWDLTGKTRLTFWIKARNPNVTGWQNAGPVISLYGKNGTLEFKPAKDGNLLQSLPFSEARWTWMRIDVPLAGDDRWTRKKTGEVQLKSINALGIALDSWGNDPFHVWLDGLSFE